MPSGVLITGVETLVCKECAKQFEATPKWRRYAGHWCPDCRRAYTRTNVSKYMKTDKGKAYLAAYKKANKPKLEKWQRNKRARRRELINAMKKDPCMDCGVSYPPYVMEFDHVRPGKVGSISMMKKNSLDAVLKEIDKCELVCSNCHAIRTHSRMLEKQKVTAASHG